jgi:uncharacterized membrane protein YuzA (DUF378 family)
MVDGYRGVFGAFLYALRQSDSLVFRSYVLVGAPLALAVTVLFGAGLIVLVAQTAAVEGGSLTLSRAFYIVVGLFVVAPLVAPVLLVARRHRRSEGHDARYDFALSLAGYLFVGSLYVGLLITVPVDQQSTPSGPIAPFVETLYALPQLAGVLPPLIASAVIVVAHRTLR